MHRLILKLMLLQVALFYHQAIAQETMRESSGPGSNVSESLISEAEEDAKLLEKVAEAQRRITTVQSTAEKLSAIKFTLRTVPNENPTFEAISKIPQWIKDPDFINAAIADAELFQVIESSIISEPSSFTTNYLCVVYGDLIATGPTRKASLTFLEALLRSGRTREQGMKILLSAWADRKSNLSPYLNSPVIKSEFQKILGLGSHDSAKHRLVSFLHAVESDDPNHELFSDAAFKKAFTVAFNEQRAIEAQRKTQPPNPGFFVKHSSHVCAVILNFMGKLKK
jgi:hypothetical protein